MSDDPVQTRLLTAEHGWLDFQDYFVRRQCRPTVRQFAFEGAERARPHPEFLVALRDERLRGVVICPSNPFISVEPILALPGVRAALAACAAPVIAVSPIIGVRAVKGPTAKMMRELGLEATASSVARRYGDLLDGFVLDEADRGTVDLGVRAFFTGTLMTNVAEKEALARTVLDAADTLTSEMR